MATVLKNFQKWKEFLNDRIDQARGAGMSDETIAKMAVQIGEFLADKVDPENAEERLLKELWDAGDQAERQTLAKLMIKLVDKT
ncbi:DUF3243 domain-containing protein [Paenibacillus thermoaerophilus]|uniref:DUF3243 domain-containing protein n=1 Tax=Paenibacillus thermoaerophilus TaxID=1215385 RepID=A0ABW2V0X6_9BACL|nr:DUF3243 domain-containing protein [Paenibacillus thermoaerophilus]TMV13858.1 DUF3243 domain-containing protein [Paenibacillus thermoaerophilus]